MVFFVLAVIFALIQYLFCKCKFLIIKFLPLGLVLAYLSVFLIDISQPLPEGSPSYALGDMVMGFLFAGVLVGIALGWLVHLIKISNSEEEDEDKSEE